MYKYINHVLASYLNPNIGNSEEDAISSLCSDLKNSDVFSKGLRGDLEKAFCDNEYSWKSAFAEYDVLYTDSEEEARSYAKNVLWLAPSTK